MTSVGTINPKVGFHVNFDRWVIIENHGATIEVGESENCRDRHGTIITEMKTITGIIANVPNPGDNETIIIIATLTRIAQLVMTTITKLDKTKRREIFVQVFVQIGRSLKETIDQDRRYRPLLGKSTYLLPSDRG